MVRPILAAVAIVLSLAAAQATAGQDTRLIRLNWTEHRDESYLPMRFHVAWVRIAGNRWTVGASFTNLSKTALRIESEQQACGKPSPCYGFSIVKTGDAYHSLVATTSTPIRIKPGATWSGVFGGSGASRLQRGVRLYISFGYFVVPATGYGFSWLTQHSFRL
jgi:hypothetical protein